MENLSHSFSKKSYGGYGFGTASHKSVYDDVFGGPPKFGMPTLAPRLEDYSEIFGGFHSARGSSIPILDLQVVDEAELCFDVRSSRFDYSEVFGGFDALDFTLSFEDLVRKSNGGDGPSDDAWSPAQSESLSDESDPSACSERSQSLSSADTPNALSGIRQVDISYHRANQRSNENTANVATDVAQLHAIPGHAYMIGENHASQRIEEPTLQASSYLKSNMDSVGIIVKEKQFKKSISLPRKCDLGSCESDFYHLEKFSGSGFSQYEPFVTVNEINLRTRPSRLPPPSRPPPVFAVKEGVSEKLNLKLKASMSYAFEQTEGDSSLPFYDVEIDGTSSMMASTTMRDAMEKVEENIRSAKESMEQKEVSRSKLQPQNDINIEEKMSKTFVSINRDDRVRGKCAKEGSGMKALAEEQNNETKMNQKVSDVVEGESYINLADKTKRRHGRESRLSYQVPNKSEGTFAWRQGTEYFEVVEADVPFKAVEQHKGENMVVQMGSDEFRCWVATEAFELREDVKDFKAAKEAPKLDVKMNKVDVAAETCGHRMRSETTMASSCQTEFQKKAEVGVHSSESEMSKNKMKMAKYHEEIKKLQNVSDKSVQNQTKADVHVAEAQAKNNQWGISERTDTGKMLMDAHGRKANERRPRENLEMDKCHTRVDNAVEQKGNEKREIKQDEKKKQEEYHETQKAKKSQTEVCERKDSQYTPRAVIEHEDNEKRLKRTIAPEEIEKNFKKSFEEDENERGQEQDCQIEIDKGRLREACMLVDNEENFELTFSQNHEERQSDACEPGKVEVRLKEDSKQGSDKSRLAAFVEDVEESSRVTRASEKSIHVSEEAGKHEELSGHAKGAEQIMKDGNDRTITLDQTTHLPIERENIKNFGGTGKPTDEVYGTILPGNLVSNLGKPKTSQADISRDEDAQFRTEGKDGEWGLDMRAANLPVEESSHSFGGNQSELQHEKHENGTVDIANFPCLHERAIDSNEAGIGIGNSSVLDKEVFQRAYDPETMRAETHEQGLRVKKIDGVQVSVNKEISNDKYKSCQPCMEWGENGKVIGAALSAVLEDTENTLNTGKKCNQTLERKEHILNESLGHEDNRIEERLQKERELENELIRKIEEEREREREREKDRMAVNRATLEARDRSYAEARERAERAAVDRATAEVRQRAMAEAREKLEKASLEARERSLADKASVEARLRVERAAVERATLEARQRAFEKAMTDKVSFEARERVERSVSDKFSSSRSVETRESSSFYDVPNLQSQSVGTSSTLRYSYSSVHTGVEGESPQRCKARLERYRRTAERAAKALAEKNMRDILAQREQSERNRLAETLDAEVKRWSSGKEGNLRALLSTLQYILGPDSGWQPIPLTEVITSASVKKAYRKATLCVHPDKLQQRGASIQQKYICEKVFDLLKEAWNIFNSEEW